MREILFVGVLILSYLLGSIPFGLLIVRLKSGVDVRRVESGRTGGTNVMRAAGFWAGFLTAILDVLKASTAVWVARWVLPQSYWLHVFAPLAAVVGHNYSIFLIERNERGRWVLRGGAGGAPTAGGAFGLWAPSLLFIVPLGLVILFIVGYASLATLSIGLLTTVIFAYRAWLGISPWAYAFFGLLAEGLLVWALRPNIQRLLHGNERRVGIFARKRGDRLSNSPQSYS